MDAAYPRRIVIKIKVTNYDVFVAATKARIAAKVKETTERVANNVWLGVIGGNPGVDYPYWSGGYTASWNFTEGAAPRDYIKSERDMPGAYEPQASSLQHLYKAYTLVTVSNANPYAQHIEDIGSPSHASPWKVAFSAYTHAIKFV